MRLRKKRIGSIGAVVRSSQSTNSASTSARRRRARRRSRRLPSRPGCRGRGPRRSRTGRRWRGATPGQVELRRSGPWLSCSRSSASGDRARGRSARSARRSTARRCPGRRRRRRAGRCATARPLMPPQAPSASPRCLGGTAAERIVSVSGSHDRAADALHARAPRSSTLDRRRERARPRRPSGEDRRGRSRTCRRRPKRSPSARADQEQHREGERVGVDRPLEALRGSRAGHWRMTGSAVVTTRLSSVVMKSAIEVIREDVQMVAVRAAHG